MAKINLLIVHSTLHIGGAEEVSANICSSIDKSQFNVTVCYLKEKGVVGDKIEQQGTHVVGLPKKNNDKTDYFTSFKLRKIIKTLDIQILHTHDVHSLTDCSICKLTIPGLKFVHTFHYGNYPYRDSPFKQLEKLFWRVPDKLISVSNNQRKGILELYNIPGNRIETLWNGVDISTENTFFDVIDKCRNQNRVIIGSINTLIKQKGMFDLIKVASRLKECHPGKFCFVIAGDGPLLKELVSEVQLNKLEDEVYFIGWVKDASKHFLPQLDIFFQPSLWEAMSMVLLEAMAANKAIVATSVGETPYILEDKVNADVVESENISQMSDALIKLVDSKSLRQQYGNAARSHYEKSFTAEKMARRYETLYNSLLNKLKKS